MQGTACDRSADGGSEDERHGGRQEVLEGTVLLETVYGESNLAVVAFKLQVVYLFHTEVSHVSIGRSVEAVKSESPNHVQSHAKHLIQRLLLSYSVHHTYKAHTQAQLGMAIPLRSSSRC